MVHVWSYVIVLGLLVGFTGADLPVHCLHEQVAGKWVFSVSTHDFSRDLRCDKNSFAITEHITINLLEPNLAVDEFGNRGYWTMVYDEGFEVVVNHRKYFAFSRYLPKDPNNVDDNASNDDDPTAGFLSLCDETMPGWFHDLNGAHWGCFIAVKAEKRREPVPNAVKPPAMTFPVSDKADLIYKPNDEYVSALNMVQTSWRAKEYPHFHGRTMRELMRMAGGKLFKGRQHRTEALAFPAFLQEVTQQQPELRDEEIPASWDWRDVNGVNYDGPIRTQGFCGSCYAVASVYMLEARIRILTNNKDQIELSPQSVVSCSEYSQGCDGGFPYLVGKFGEDFGILSEQCMPYSPDAPCEARCRNELPRRVTNYHYIGGYYGGCNEKAMRHEIYKKGPIAISFEAHPDFMYYSGGIYHHVEDTNGVASKNHWEKTSHSISLVGYGEEAGEKYWIAKNTWGPDWGENGYFRIRRGTDESALESMALAIDPVIE